MPLIVGTVLALAALAYVLWPIITAAEGRPKPSVRPPDSSEPAKSSETVSDDPVEAEVRRARAQMRVCPVCGPRPELAPRYCSRCGRPLA